MTTSPGRPTRLTPPWALGVLLATLAGSAGAARPPDARLDEITALAERDNAQARATLVHEGPTPIAGAPYAVRIRYLRLLHRVQADAGNLRDAHETNALILRLAEAERDPLMTALAGLARVQRSIEQDDPAGALGQLAALGERHRGLASPEFSAGVEALHGMAYGALGQYERARPHFQAALGIVERHPGLWSPRASAIRLALARNDVDAGDPARALAALRALRAGAERLPPGAAAAAHFHEGRALVAQASIEPALRAFDRALELAQAQGSIALEASVLANIASAHLKARRYPQAEQAARAALALAGRGEDRIGPRMAKASLGFALIGQGRQRDGMALVDAVLGDMRQAGATAAVGRLLADKRDALEGAGRLREALAIARERETVLQEVARNEHDMAISALRAQFAARERAALSDTLRQEQAARDADLRHRSLVQRAATLGTALAVFLCAGLLWLVRKSARDRRRLAELSDELAYRSARDPLTGLYNRRAFQDRMRSRTGEAAPRLGSADCFILLDIDHFKRINDEHGHAAGDAVLAEVGTRLDAALRESDMVLRWGGEEFLVYCQGVSQEQRPLLLRRILDAIAATPFVLADGSVLALSATAGAVALPFATDGADQQDTSQPDWEQAIALADRALYKGKEAGRNRGYIVAGLRSSEGALELDLVLPGAPA